MAKDCIESVFEILHSATDRDHRELEDMLSAICLLHHRYHCIEFEITKYTDYRNLTCEVFLRIQAPNAQAFVPASFSFLACIHFEKSFSNLNIYQPNDMENLSDHDGTVN